MSHRVGALLMPAPPPPFGKSRPSEEVDAVLDPAVSVMGSFLKAVLEFYCGTAWRRIAPGNPIVRTLITGRDPEEIAFIPTSLPLLAVWREHDGAPQRHDDASVQAPSAISVLWVPPPSDDPRLGLRSPFFNNFVKAMQLAYQNERDPCWVRPEDEANPDQVQRAVARTYGSYVWGLAGIDSWTYSGTKRVPVQVGIGPGQQPQTYVGYMASWTILESTQTDPAQLGSTINGERIGVEPTSIRFDVTDQAGDPADGVAIVRQSGFVPP